jgi:APA family basic amino acid/polyamine antiporter
VSYVNPPGGLARELGLLEVTLAGVGIILGAGIYALIGVAAGQAGNAVWLSFAISAVAALFTALSYAELSSMYPRAGAEYEYTVAAVGEFVAFVVGWLIILSGIIAAAAVSLGFSGYFAALTGAPLILPAAVLVAVLAVVLLIGIRESAFVAVIFTLVEAGGLLLIIVAGIPFLGSVDYLEMPLGLSGVFTAAALVFFAFLGFEEMVKFSEETTSPERTIPKALMLALAICTTLYILVSISAVSVVGWEGLASSDAPFTAVAIAAWGEAGAAAISIIALFATANTVLLLLLAASRITYGMARSGTLPKMLSRVHRTRRTPYMAILGVSAASLLFLFLGDIGFVANVSNFTLFVTFVVVNGSVIVLRLKRPGTDRPFTIPGAIAGVPVFPVLGILSCAFLFIQLTPEVVALGAVLTIAGGIAALFAGRRIPES